MLPILSFTTLALQFLFASGLAVEYSVTVGTVEDISSLMRLPPTIPAPTAPLSYVALAIGTQHFTCSSGGTYTNVGVIAELFDISGLINSPETFDKVTDATISAWNTAPLNQTPQDVISSLSMLKDVSRLGQLYYVTNPATGTGVNPKWDSVDLASNVGIPPKWDSLDSIPDNGVNPKWDFIASQHDPDATVVAAKSAGAAALTGGQDMDWALFKAIAGKLANQIYLTDTRLGQPPASCAPGSAPLAVKFAAKYWLM